MPLQVQNHPGLDTGRCELRSVAQADHRISWGGLPVIAEDSEEFRASAELIDEESACLFYTREAVSAFGKFLIQLPVVLHNTPKLSENSRHEEYRALLNTGANNSFISTKRVQELGLEIDTYSAAVNNGDGSTQLWFDATEPGTVQVSFSIGSRFKTTARLRVINLDIFDVIIGMYLFLRHQFTFEYDPFQISAICPRRHCQRGG